MPTDLICQQCDVVIDTIADDETVNSRPIYQRGPGTTRGTSWEVRDAANFIVLRGPSSHDCDNP